MIGRAVDRALAEVAPGLAARRMASRRLAEVMAARGAHKGARRDRAASRLWHAEAGSPNADTVPDLPALRARSRDLARNDMIAHGALATVTGGVVGAGLRPVPKVDAEALGLSDDDALAWQREARRQFDAWRARADWHGVLSFDALTALAFRAHLESGDVFVVRRFDPADDALALRLQVIEGDHCENPHHRPDTPRLRGGVVLDAAGRPRGYHFADRHPGEDVLAGRGTLRWRYVPRTDREGRALVLHLYRPTRPGQVRGLPWLAPVLEALKQLSRYSDAELMAAVNAAKLVAFVTADMDPDQAAAVLGQQPGEGQSPVDVSGYSIGEDGTVVGLRPGETVDVKTPGRPNTAYEQFTHALLREIGVALGIPFELLVQHFTASYSASRAALEMAWQSFRAWRAWLAGAFLDPVWEWFLTEAVARGTLQAPGFLDDPRRRAAWSAVDWLGPSRMTLDPKKESDADLQDVAAGVKTLDQVIAERTGGTWEAKHAQRTREVAARVAAGLAEPVTPRAAASGANEDDDGGDDD